MINLPQIVEQLKSEKEQRTHSSEGIGTEQASYEVAHARRQYDAVDPENRLVAAELERVWNETLKAQFLLQAELEQLRQAPHDELSAAAKAGLLSLGTDLPRVWNHPTSSPEIKKRILRTVLQEIVVNIRDNKVHTWCCIGKEEAIPSYRWPRIAKGNIDGLLI